MSRKSFRIALGIVAGTLLVLGLVGGYFYYQVKKYPDRPHPGTGREVAVEIEPGMSFPAIARRLHEAGVIDRPRWFRIFAMSEGATTKVRSGKYTLRDDMTPRAVLGELLKGVPEETVWVTVPEGLHFIEVSQRIAAAGLSSEQELVDTCRDPEFLEKFGIEGDSCEGYLFPSRYDFRKQDDAETILTRMIEQHRIVWQRVRQDHGDELDKLKKRLDWTDRDVLIMASIVEKEAVVDSERPRIAQVFINRLVSPTFVPHRLDTDPTIRYGCMVPVRKSAACQAWNSTDRLYRKQLDDADNPYNTYQHEGLPPGPICNPGEAALRATVKPDGSKFLYFVSRNDGTHVFSRTRAEHERAVNKYQR